MLNPNFWMFSSPNGANPNRSGSEEFVYEILNPNIENARSTKD